eukprot:TRINITY_DN3479_c7_g1_i1.p1 TRINITY_DN3479_c7_g1~~TRINITY_DN3479_c7_g1_i1.p1  ORF type:complete len:147 (+),score=21.43 TRINITY_DN3479_c7_g1_i1:36-443(+)
MLRAISTRIGMRAYCQPTDGIDWKKDGLPQLNPREVNDYLKEQNKGTIIDVREHHELAAVSVESHKIEHLPMMQILENKDVVPEDLGTEENPAFVLCHAGVRSQTIGGLLSSMGRTHVANIKGGIVNWKKWEGSN